MDEVIAEADGGIGVIMISRPEARNAVNGAAARAIARAVDDLIVASETATFGLPEVRRGLVAGGGGLLRLPRRIPYHLATEIALTEERFPATRLHQAGLINRLVPAGQALAGARQLAASVAPGAPLALTVTKQVIAQGADWDSDEAFARQDEIVSQVFTSADAMEGAIAFVEKRTPSWRGE